MDSCLSQGYWHKVKCKQLCPGFELRLTIPFPTMITITISLLSFDKMYFVFLSVPLINVFNL